MSNIPLLDLRSEKEFYLGHIPRAVNLPLLNNQERHEIGTLYKHEGKSPAVSRGLEIFAEKADVFLQKVETLAPDKKLILYCWRGGMRSRLVAYWLTLAGFQVEVIRGGYKSFRRDVLDGLDKLARHPKLVLNGRTGSGKSQFLEDMRARGCGVINLEQLAQHRGSTFGGIAQKESSPSQQTFENLLYEAYLQVSSHPRLLLEIENFIGPVSVPQRVRESLRGSPMIFLSRNFEDRLDLIQKVYCEGWNRETEYEFISNLVLLRKYLSRAEEEEIILAVRRKDFSFAISQLLQLRYDRVYDKSLKRHQQQAIAHFNLSEEEELARSYVQKILTENSEQLAKTNKEK